MEHIDSEKARRVWQRVQGVADPSEQGMDLQELIARKLQDSAVYLQLSRRVRGRDGAALQRLHRQAQSQAAILKGMCAMNLGVHPRTGASPAVNQTVPVLLRRCYGREMQTLAEYRRREQDAQYGEIFRELAEQTRAHCRILLELLGHR